MTYVASAEGKVILLGEHSVVYGHPAIVTGIAQGATAVAEPSNSSLVHLGDQTLAPGEGDIGAAFQSLLAELGNPTVEVSANLAMPAGLGLGASAALGVAIARAILRLSPSESSSPASLQERERRAANAWERQFHGTPSGIDVAAASLGGCIRFSRNDGATPLRLGAPLHLAIGFVGPQVSTKTMVLGLAALRERKPTLVHAAMQTIGELVERATIAIEGGNVPELGQLMNENQILLQRLELSTERLENACRIAIGAGALGAKLTGKGGGGCAIALCEACPSCVLEAWKRVQIDGFSTVVSAATNEPKNIEQRRVFQ